MKWPPPVVLPSLTIMPLSSSPSSPSQSHALHPRARRARARISWPARHDLVPPRSRPLCLPSPAIELGSLSSMSGGSRWSSGPREGILGWRTEEELRASMAGRGTRGHGSSVPWLLAAAEGTSRRTGCEARIGKAPSSDLESVEGGGGSWRPPWPAARKLPAAEHCERREGEEARSSPQGANTGVVEQRVVRASPSSPARWTS
jgi:hypothetical protein